MFSLYTLSVLSPINFNATSLGKTKRSVTPPHASRTIWIALVDPMFPIKVTNISGSFSFSLSGSGATGGIKWRGTRSLDRCKRRMAANNSWLFLCPQREPQNARVLKPRRTCRREFHVENAPRPFVARIRLKAQLLNDPRRVFMTGEMIANALACVMSA